MSSTAAHLVEGLDQLLVTKNRKCRLVAYHQKKSFLCFKSFCRPSSSTIAPGELGGPAGVPQDHRTQLHWAAAQTRKHPPE
eukprot:1147546-Pelagomonas_calceolata.AAC.2